MKDINFTNEEYKTFAREVYRYSYFKLQNKYEAEDVTSETFKRYLEKGKSIKTEDLNKWLIGIARNVIYEKYRELKYINLNASEIYKVIDDDSNIENQIYQKDLANIVKNHMEKLDEEDKEVLILKIWEDMKFNEISEILNQKESTVKLRYYRSLEKIKESMSISSNKKYSFTLPVITSAIFQLKNSAEFSLSSKFLTSLTSRDLSLNLFSKILMKSYIIKIALISLVPISVLVGIGVFLLNTYNNKENKSGLEVSEEKEIGTMLYSKELECPVLDAPEIKNRYKFTIEVTSEEQVIENDCGIEINGEGYKLGIHVPFDGVGDILRSKEEAETFVEVNTPKLNVSYDDDYERKSIVRIPTKEIENRYIYLSYFQNDPAKCTSWQSLDPIFGCIGSGISLKTTELEVYCDVKNENAVLECDRLINTLDVEQIK